MGVCEKDWIDVLTSLAVPLIALMTAWIAYQQWQTSEKARRRETSDRYFENYHKLSTALDSVFQKDRITPEDREKLWLARDEARLYLPDEIADYTQNILEQANKAFDLERLLQTLPIGEERSAKVNEKSKIIENLTKLETHKVYRKYMVDK